MSALRRPTVSHEPPDQQLARRIQRQLQRIRAGPDAISVGEAWSPLPRRRKLIYQQYGCTARSKFTEIPRRSMTNYRHAYGKTLTSAGAD